MPVTFNYVRAEIPPGPYVLVTVARPDGSSVADDLPAKIDTGADRTVIPTAVTNQLKLDEVERREFEALGGYRVVMAIVQAVVTIRGCPSLLVNAAGSDGEPHILLGRDVLNNFRILLDGPNLRLEIG
jgi:predicted aspartyl protease